jgi:hypothetical protein
MGQRMDEPARNPLRQDRRQLPQLRSNRRNPSLDAICPHGLKLALRHFDLWQIEGCVIKRLSTKLPKSPILETSNDKDFDHEKAYFLYG